MKPKYKILFTTEGITKEINFPNGMKEEAINTFKNIRMRSDRIRFFSIDSEDDSIWYDLTNKY